MDAKSSCEVNPAVTAADIAGFERDGFVVARGLFSSEEMRDIQAWTDEVHAWAEEPGVYMMYFEETLDGRRVLNRLEDFVPYHAGFERLAHEGWVSAMLERLLGERAVLFKDKINFKLPGGGGFEAHQDVQAGWAKYGKAHVTALVSIDAMTPENGCLEIAPRKSVELELMGQEWAPLTAEQLGGVQFEPVETEPGDAVFFDSFVPHGSARNTSALQRRALYLTYNRASEGDSLRQYYTDKRASYPPDIEREKGREYRFRV
ncbi:MAG: phytanoyl-CoA dioxygenase family protein [bacterium]|nr:phytanoyl-CoA dioxygenase family protein [bacterium]